MAKDKISDYSSTANSNTDIAGINIDEGCAPSGINDAIRTLMAQLKTWQSGGQDVYIHPAGSASAPSITANGDTNTGIFFPAADTVGITTGGTERLRVDSSGNMGLGVTPSAWNSVYRSMQFGITGAISGRTDTTLLELAANAYRNSGGSFIYLTTDLAARYDIGAGVHRWYNAPSGTAGNAITFTQAMTLDASGNLGVGTTSPSARLTVVTGASGNNEGTIRVSDNASFYGELRRVNASDEVRLGSYGSSQNLTFYTVSSERARIDSSGNLLVGTTSNSRGARLRVDGGETAFLTGYGNGYGIGVWMTPNASATGGTATPMSFQNVSNTTVGTITTTASATAYNTSSDYRLKNITGTLTGYKERLLALEPKQGSWKVDGSEFRGFLAHEFANSYPSSVNGEKDAVDTDGNPQYQGMQAGSPEVIADLVAYIKELETRLAALEQV